MAVQSLTTLPAWPSSSVRKDLTPTQQSSLLSTVSNSLSNAISITTTTKNAKSSTGKTTKATDSLATSTITFLRSYLLDQAFQKLQAAIWVTEDEKSPSEKAIHAKVLKLTERLAEEGGLDDLKILTDLAIVYARSSPSKLRHIFNLCALNSPNVVTEVETALVPSFTAILQSTQGLYNQRKAAEVIYCFMVACSGASKIPGIPDAPLLAPFIKHVPFITALSNLYLPGLSSTAWSYGGTRALLSAISAVGTTAEVDPTEWTTIWVKTKLTLIDSFHLLFKQSLANLTQANGPQQLAEQAETIFSAIFAMLETSTNGSDESTSSGATPPTPFLNLTLLQDYQRSHDLTQLLTGALSKAQERDARLDILESTLVEHGSYSKEPGALTILLHGSGLQRPAPSKSVDAKGKGPTTTEVPSTTSYSAEIDDVELVSKTSQILDLLPDLSTQYVGKLLKHPAYDGNVERVIEALLEGSAPDEATLDSQRQQPVQRQASPVPERRNIFDDEAVDFSSVRFGKKAEDAATLLAKPDQGARERMKADILRRVEIMDMESDEEEEGEEEDGAKPKPKIVAFEEDDDIEEPVRVPGAGDLEDPEGESESDGEPGAEGTPGEVDPEYLIEQAYVADPSAFARDAATRRSKARAELIQKTGWSHEQIEGWAIVLERNPKKKDKILLKHEFRGNVAGPLEPQSSSEPGRGGHHRGRGRGGRGGGRGGRGGGGGGQGGGQGEGSGSRGNARGRAWKDRNKATRANHDRKRGHDKKMARAGGPS
ncbi:hypothetical protein CC1G_03283 [Coprinopsis cinerea okayama7|uniref:CUE domain-containing protein n=1 Tax=Coprinopsis cinerea (strain Okayama-7 / 130 / ATCC MYA-4618 / FGSC 9003) TaxID=240176 RepID=A8N7E0_COPC7|nr:hypothetical protein CC1G_03283 [Coprinopsis cinerea okayama7\|eukprot:XP_001830746.1 hypothetical protein CC1G_03283 [Coprinopsis cinerea okayama7\